MREMEILKELVEHTYTALSAIEAVMDKYGLVEFYDKDRIILGGEIDKIFALYRNMIND